MSREARFWDKRAKKYAQRPVSDQETYEKKLEITRGYFRPDSEVLEIGCGTGSTALAHAPYVKHVVATDISPAMINIAKDKARAGQVENVTFEIRAADDHDIPQSRYDVIMAHNLLHLLKEPEPVIKAAFRGLKPGGVFHPGPAEPEPQGCWLRNRTGVAAEEKRGRFHGRPKAGGGHTKGVNLDDGSRHSMGHCPLPVAAGSAAGHLADPAGCSTVG
jgi:ubiquinone/menaquinone biosynthesis C-methylase UbiE